MTRNIRRHSAVPLAFACLLISACSASPTIRHDQVFIESKVVDQLPLECPAGALACSVVTGPLCQIYIRRDIYPACIAHEVRHCHEGEWHQSPSSEDC